MKLIQLRDGTFFSINPSVIVSATQETDVNGDFVLLHYNDINQVKDIELFYENLQDYQSVINSQF